MTNLLGVLIDAFFSDTMAWALLTVAMTDRARESTKQYVRRFYWIISIAFGIIFVDVTFTRIGMIGVLFVVVLLAIAVAVYELGSHRETDNAHSQSTE